MECTCHFSTGTLWAEWRETRIAQKIQLQQVPKTNFVEQLAKTLDKKLVSSSKTDNNCSSIEWKVFMFNNNNNNI